MVSAFFYGYSLNSTMAKKKYAIVDIETTGGMARRDRITEIAVVLHDGEKEIDRFESLINPERNIPYNIIQITGITNEMVAQAPKFFEVAKRVVQITDGAVFVAHNVRFDYTFIKEEFARLGYTFTKRQLCTVRLTRQAFPGLGSYSLGNLIQHFGIRVNQRHRAMADVEATVEVFEHILDKDVEQVEITTMVNKGIKEAKLPAGISIDQLHELPEIAGVYYFHDSEGKVVYIGKSVNIQKRVFSHFSKTTRKAEKLVQYVADISYEITGSELVALLLESYEIKDQHPHINRAQRARSFPYVIYAFEDENGYRNLDIKKASIKEKKTLQVLHSYPSQGSAKGAMARMVEEFELCKLLCHLETVSKPCFNYHIQKCKGACITEENADHYNDRLEDAIATLGKDFPQDFILLDPGRTAHECSVVLVEKGQYQGFGFVDRDTLNGNIDELKDCIKRYPHNPEIARIIRHYVLKENMERMILLEQVY